MCTRWISKIKNPNSVKSELVKLKENSEEMKNNEDAVVLKSSMKNVENEFDDNNSKVRKIKFADQNDVQNSKTHPHNGIQILVNEDDEEATENERKKDTSNIKESRHLKVKPAEHLPAISMLENNPQVINFEQDMKSDLIIINDRTNDIDENVEISLQRSAVSEQIEDLSRETIILPELGDNAEDITTEHGRSQNCEGSNKFSKPYKSKRDEEYIKTALNEIEAFSRYLSPRTMQNIIHVMYKESEEKFSDLTNSVTVKCLQDGIIWKLDKKDYEGILMDTMKCFEERYHFLKNVSFLGAAGEDLLHNLATLVKTEYFTTQTQLNLDMNENPEKFYIILAGNVVVKRKSGEYFKFTTGQYFRQEQSTIKIDSSLLSFNITKEQFNEHLEPIMKKQLPNGIQKSKQASNEYDFIELSDLKSLKTIGTGRFGRVLLVQHRKKPEILFSLKYIRKIDVVINQNHKHVYRQKHNLLECNSPFIARLLRTFKDKTNVYFLLEPCMGGDIIGLLHRQKKLRFNESGAKYICGCITEALVHLNQRKIIHRNIKAENILIDSNGIFKISDFEFSKKLQDDQKAFSFGNIDRYSAPELVLEQGYDRAVDYWAFGVLIYEILTGITPFQGVDDGSRETCNKILTGVDKVEFPNYLSQRVCDLIKSLCRPLPKERLGYRKIRDMKAHKWFVSLDWVRLENCKLASPYKPKLKSVVDMSYLNNLEEFLGDEHFIEETSMWDANF